MDIQQILRDIKKELRTSMNGVASARMRESGINYKLNFGVELPRLQQIATEFPSDHDLAQALWKENARECKILAGILQPEASFYPEIADIWVETMPTAELAQLTTMHLFCRMPSAAQKAFEWMADEREMFLLCGLLLITRLLMQDIAMNERAENEFLDQAECALNHSNLHIKRAAISAIQKFMNQSETNWNKGEIILSRSLNS